MELPISERTWAKLIELNEAAAWAEKGVFATAVGSRYVPNASRSILYVGKSAGKLGTSVSSADDQAAIGEDSRKWMENWRSNNPRSSFWQFAQSLTDTKNMAWTNVCKMDKASTKGEPPRGSNWRFISEICLRALSEEIDFLKPKTIIFTISNDYKGEIVNFISSLGFGSELVISDGYTKLFVDGAGNRCYVTRHPQGWPNIGRMPLISSIKSKMA